MFRKELEDKLKKIFGVKKTTYDAPSDDGPAATFEQDTLFIHVQQARSNPSQGKIRAKVTGSLTMFSKKDAMPFGFFSKKIHNAESALTKDFFFFDMDVDVANSPARVINISERRVSFIYFYQAKFDPKQKITEYQGDCSNG